MILTGALSRGMQDSAEGRIVLAREICWLSSIGIGLIGFALELFFAGKEMEEDEVDARWWKDPIG